MSNEILKTAKTKQIIGCNDTIYAMLTVKCAIQQFIKQNQNSSREENRVSF